MFSINFLILFFNMYFFHLVNIRHPVNTDTVYGPLNVLIGTRFDCSCISKRERKLKICFLFTFPIWPWTLNFMNRRNNGNQNAGKWSSISVQGHTFCPVAATCRSHIKLSLALTIKHWFAIMFVAKKVCLSRGAKPGTKNKQVRDDSLVRSFQFSSSGSFINLVLFLSPQMMLL